MDSGMAEFAAMKVCSRVVADNTHVMRTQAPSLAGDESGGYLSAGHDLRAEHFDFGAEGGELRELQDGVGGVFADAEDVESRGRHNVVVQGIGREGKCKAG